MRLRNKYRKKYQMQVRVSKFRKKKPNYNNNKLIPFSSEIFLAWSSVTGKIQFAALCKYFRATSSLISRYSRYEYLLWNLNDPILTIVLLSRTASARFYMSDFKNFGSFFSRSDNGGPSSRLGRSIRSRRVFPRTCGETVIWNNTRNDNEFEWEGVNDLTVRYRVSRMLLYDHWKKVLYISILNEEGLLRKTV